MMEHTIHTEEETAIKTYSGQTCKQKPGSAKETRLKATETHKGASRKCKSKPQEVHKGAS